MSHGHALIDFGPLKHDVERDVFTCLASFNGTHRQVQISRSALYELAAGADGSPSEIFDRYRDRIGVATAEQWERFPKDEAVELNSATI